MKIKLGISLILAILAFIFITQNIEPVMVDFLAWSAEISVALLVFVMLGTGIIIGWLLSSYLRFARKRKQIKGQENIQAEADSTQKESDITIQGDKKAHE